MTRSHSAAAGSSFQTLESVRFRFADAADAYAITALIELAYRGPAVINAWDSEAHLLRGPRTSVEEVSALILDPGSRFVVATLGGEVCGCALIQKRATTSCASESVASSGAYFGMFAVNPNLRTAGLGKALLAECERCAAQLWGCASMVMTVINVRHTLIEWYQRRGYRLTGARMPFPFSPTSGETTRDFDLVEMRKEL